MISDYTVIKLVAISIDGTGPNEGQVLQVVAEGIGDGGLDGIDAFIFILGHLIVQIVYHIGIVAFAAVHDIRADAAVEGVVASIPIEDVVVAVAGDFVVEVVAVSVDGTAAFHEGQVLHIDEDLSVVPHEILIGQEVHVD